MTEPEVEQLLALFHRKYRAWCGAEYLDGSKATQRALLAAAVTTQGAPQIRLGIEVLFGPEMSWVGSKSLDFITNDEKWSKHTAQAVARRSAAKSKGEQSEFSGTVTPGTATTMRTRGK